MSASVGMSLRKDYARAKAIGLNPTIRGWRKKLAAIELSALQEESANALVAKANGRSRLSRIQKETPGGFCPYELHPEMECVTALYRDLIAAGFDTHLEVSVPSPIHRSGFMRVDVAILRGDQLVVAIECKRDGKAMGKNTRQAQAYQTLKDIYGVQIYFVNSRCTAIELVEVLKSEWLRGALPRHGA